MNILFEEHAAAQRAGGIEAATAGLAANLAKLGVVVTRRFTDVRQDIATTPDCVHIHGIWSPALAMRLVHWRRRGIPCVVTVHGMLEPWALAHKRFKKQLAWSLYQRALLNRASALHATSAREATNLRALGMTSRIDNIHWGVEMPEVGKALNLKHEILNVGEEEIDGQICHSKSKIAPLRGAMPEVGKALNLKHKILNVGEEKSDAPVCHSKSKIASLRGATPEVGKALNLKHEILNVGEEEIDGQICHSKSKIKNPKSSSLSPRTALFVGRIFPVKGLPMLVEAWAMVRPPGWKMQIVGPDEAGHQAEVAALINQAGLDAEFTFSGSLQGADLCHAYAAADLFILPSHTENFGMVVAEALSHGVPVIATNGTPWSELLEHNCGWWPEISSTGIAAALRAATTIDPAELRRMGAHGQQWMHEEFTWDQCARKMVALYQSL